MGVACGRKLSVLVWHVLSPGEPFRYADPKTLEAKCARLRVQATSMRRKGGIAKGSPRSPHYAQERTRAISSLDQGLAVVVPTGIFQFRVLIAVVPLASARGLWSFCVSDSVIEIEVTRVVLHSILQLLQR